MRDVEQRIVRAESINSNFEVPEQPVGVPETFKEYIELMFDLQVLAFQADITRVSSLMMARENVNRSYPEIGLPEAHHSISHHGNNPEKMKNYAKLNAYHVETLGYLPEEAADRSRKATARCWISTAVLLGSGMSDGNTHNNYNVPVIVVGGKAHNVKSESPREISRRGRRSRTSCWASRTGSAWKSDKFGDSTSEIDLLTV